MQGAPKRVTRWSHIAALGVAAVVLTFSQCLNAGTAPQVALSANTPDPAGHASLPPPPLASALVIASQNTRVTDIRVAWSPAPDATGHEIWRGVSTNLQESALLIGFPAIVFPSYDDRSAVPGTDYYYWVRGSNAFGFGPFGNMAKGVRRPIIPGDLLDSWKVVSEPIGSPVIDTNGIVYVSVLDPGLTDPTVHSHLIALGPKTRINWDSPMRWRAITSPVLASDNTLYIGTRENENDIRAPGALVAFTTTGEERWSRPIPSGVRTPPVVGDDNTVFVGSLEGVLRAFSPDGTLKWSIALSNRISMINIGEDGTLHCGLDNRVVAIHEGEILWSSPIPDSAFYGEAEYPIGLRGELYLVPWIPSGLTWIQWGIESDGTRQPAWTNQYSSTWIPVIGQDGSIFLNQETALTNTLTRLNPDKTIAWTVPTKETHLSSLAISSNGYVYTAGSGSRLTAYSPAGKTAWAFSLGAPCNSGITISPEGTIVVGASSGKIYALAGNGPPSADGWPMPGQNARHTRRTPKVSEPLGQVSSPLSVLGGHNDRIHLSWASVPHATRYRIRRSTTPDITEATDLAMTTGSEFDDPSASPGVAYSYWILPINAVEEGQWSHPIQGFRRVAQIGEYLENSPSYLGFQGPISGNAAGQIFLSSGGLLSINSDLSVAGKWTNGKPTGVPSIGANGNSYLEVGSGKLAVLSSTGSVVAFYPDYHASYLPPCLHEDGTLILVDPYRHVLRYDPLRRTVDWVHQPTTMITCEASVATDGSVLFGTMGGQLIALNDDGSLKWKYPVAGRIQSGPAIGRNGNIYFGTDIGGVYALDPSGRTLWAATTDGGDLGPISLGPDGTVYVGSYYRVLYAFDSGGRRRWTVANPSAVMRSVCVGDDGVIYCVSEPGSINALTPDGQPIWTFRLTPHYADAPYSIPLLSPLLMDHRLWVPTEPVSQLVFSAGTPPPFGSASGFVTSSKPLMTEWSQYRGNRERTGVASGPLRFSKPQFDRTWIEGESMRIGLEFTPSTDALSQATLFEDGQAVESTQDFQGGLKLQTLSKGLHSVWMEAQDKTGQSYKSAKMRLWVESRPTLQIHLNSKGQIEIQFQPPAGRNCTLRRSATLDEWDVPGVSFSSSDTPVVWVDPHPISATTFYQLRIEE